MHSQLINSPQQLFPVCLSLLTCCHSAPFRRFLVPQHGRKPKRICGAPCGKGCGLPPAPEPESSTPRQIAMPECATEPYNPHLLGQAVEEGGNDGGTEGWIRRKRGRMMEWLLNIQHAGESRRCCWVSALWRRAAAPSLHRFRSYFRSSFWKSCVSFPRLLSFV